MSHLAGDVCCGGGFFFFFLIYLQRAPLHGSTTCSGVHVIHWLFFWSVINIITQGFVFYVLYTINATGQNIVN